MSETKLTGDFNCMFKIRDRFLNSDLPDPFLKQKRVKFALAYCIDKFSVFKRKIELSKNTIGSTETLVRLLSRCSLLVHLCLDGRDDTSILLAAAAQHCPKLRQLYVNIWNINIWNYAPLEEMAGIAEVCTYYFTYYNFEIFYFILLYR